MTQLEAMTVPVCPMSVLHYSKRAFRKQDRIVRRDSCAACKSKITTQLYCLCSAVESSARPRSEEPRTLWQLGVNKWLAGYSRL